MIEALLSIACIAIAFTMLGWCWHAFLSCAEEEGLWDW